MAGTIAAMRTESMSYLTSGNVRLGRLVELQSDGSVIEAPAASEEIIGVAIEGNSSSWPLSTSSGEDQILSGQRVSVLMTGVAYIRRDAAYAAPAPGHLVKSAAGGAVTQYVIGVDSPDIRVGIVLAVTTNYVLVKFKY